MTLLPPSLSRLGLGCARVGSIGNPASPAQLRALMRRALELGVTVFDTADIYGQGDSEREIGRVLAGRRQDGFVVTKFGKRFSAAMRAIGPLKPLIRPLLSGRSVRGAVVAQRGKVIGADFSPARLTAALDASLRRLRFDAVDAVLLHGPSVEVLRDPTTAEVLASVVLSGKALRAGVSVDTREELQAAAAIAGVGALQVPLDLAPELSGADWAPRIARGEVIVFVREVLRLQPDLPAGEALRRAIADSNIACAVVGTSRTDHLEDLVRAIGT